MWLSTSIWFHIFICCHGEVAWSHYQIYEESICSYCFQVMDVVIVQNCELDTEPRKPELPIRSILRNDSEMISTLNNAWIQAIKLAAYFVVHGRQAICIWAICPKQESDMPIGSSMSRQTVDQNPPVDLGFHHVRSLEAPHSEGKGSPYCPELPSLNDLLGPFLDFFRQHPLCIFRVLC